MSEGRDEQPSVTVAEIRDPSVAGQGLELLELDAVKLSSTPFRARRVIVRLEGAAVIFQSTNHHVRTRTKTQRGLLAFVTFAPGARGTAHGLPIRPGLMLAVEAETEVAFVPEAAYQSLAFLVPPEDLRAHLRDRSREADLHLPRGAEALQAEVQAVRRLFEWGQRLVDLAARQPALFDDHQEQRAAARAEMVETLLATLGSARELAPDRADHAQQSQAAVVKAAEDYALRHPDERVYVTDLCRAAAVSERALEYAFKQVLGLTPVAFLTRLRLHRARQALLAASHRSTTVSAVALDWGFWHFGEFSRAYRECFGELPSDTLRRKPGANEG